MGQTKMENKIKKAVYRNDRTSLAIWWQPYAWATACFCSNIFYCVYVTTKISGWLNYKREICYKVVIKLAPFVVISVYSFLVTMRKFLQALQFCCCWPFLGLSLFLGVTWAPVDQVPSKSTHRSQAIHNKMLSTQSKVFLRLFGGARRTYVLTSGHSQTQVVKPTLIQPFTTTSSSL